MDKNLFKLLLTRYWKILLLTILLIIGYHFFQATSAVNYWHQQQKFYQTDLAKEEFKEYYLDEAGYYVYTPAYSNKEKKTKDFKVYREHSLLFFSETDYTYGYYGYNSSYFSENSFFYLVIAITLGFCLFFYDLKTNFNTLLFSSRFSKKQIYWSKHLLVGSTLVTTLLISKAITILVITVGIPEPYLNANPVSMILSSLSAVLLTLLSFVVSSFTGLLLGEWLTGVATLIGFFLSFSWFISSLAVITDLFNYYILKIPLNDSTVLISSIKQFVFAFSNYQPPLWHFILFIGLIFGFLLVGGQLFKQSSLDHNGEYLLFPFLKLPLLITFTIYCTITLGCQNFSFHLYDGNISAPNFFDFIISLGVPLIISLALGYGVIYRKIPFYKPKT